MISHRLPESGWPRGAAVSQDTIELPPDLTSIHAAVCAELVGPTTRMLKAQSLVVDQLLPLASSTNWEMFRRTFQMTTPSRTHLSLPPCWVPAVVMALMALWSANIRPMRSGDTGTPRTRDHFGHASARENNRKPSPFERFNGQAEKHSVIQAVKQSSHRAVNYCIDNMKRF